LKSGKVVAVREHTDKRTKAPEKPKADEWVVEKYHEPQERGGKLVAVRGYSDKRTRRPEEAIAPRGRSAAFVATHDSVRNELAGGPVARGAAAQVIAPSAAAKRRAAEAKDTGERIVSLPLSSIRPDPEQHRKTFVPAKLRELADSMKEAGQKEAIKVRRIEGAGKVQYQIIAGERRWRAANLIGLKTLKAVVREGVT
jgi:uncharacterized ParB-like nuclease family protein